MAGVIVVDRAVGRLRYQGVDQTGLLFPPSSHARYDAADFTFLSSINRMGFRDREFRRSKTSRYRVVAIGDSYTYGWGVNVDESWPKAVERQLRQAGLSVEIANLGRPGDGPHAYAATAEKALPVLRPDLVIVALLQGDDIEQEKYASELRAARPEGPGPWLSLGGLARRFVPNLLRVLQEGTLGRDTVEIAAEWRREAEKIRDDFTEDEAARYGRLDAEIRESFESGRLNPPLIRSGLRRPDYWMDTFDPDAPAVQELVHSLGAQLGRVKAVAARQGAAVLVVSIPMGHYLDRRVLEQRRRYGFRMDDRMLTTHAEDIEIERATAEAGLPYVSFTSSFRRETGANFYFRLDTHLNAAGHAFFARQIAPVVARTLGMESK